MINYFIICNNLKSSINSLEILRASINLDLWSIHSLIDLQLLEICISRFAAYFSSYELNSALHLINHYKLSLWWKMPIFGVVAPSNLPSLYKLISAQKINKSPVIKFLLLNLIVNNYKTFANNYRNCLYKLNTSYYSGIQHCTVELNQFKLQLI